MKQIDEIGLTDFLRKKRNWLGQRKECSEKRGIKYCDECKRWPFEFLKRPVLVPVELKKCK